MFLDTQFHTVPAGFAIDPDQAIAAAKTSRRMQAIHRAHHPLRIAVLVWVRDHYEIYFYFHGKVIADQIVGPEGQLGPTYTGPLITGIYARGGVRRDLRFAVGSWSVQRDVPASAAAAPRALVA